jgi:hypothetical protein
MQDFTAALLREKMVFTETGEGAGVPVIIRSNRIFFKLGDERIVVRAQTMHVALLLASRAAAVWFKEGPYADRAEAFDWEQQWHTVLSNYEKRFNPDIWAAIYINGIAVFRTRQERFMDVIEKCAILNDDSYDAALGVAEKVLAQLGRPVQVTHAAAAAAVFGDHAGIMQAGIIHRAQNNLVVNFTAEGGDFGRRVVQGMVTAAAFLEALNLRFIAKGIQNRIWMQEVQQASLEGFRLRGAIVRLVALNKWIDTFEKNYIVTYRPEKPELFIKE